MVVVIELPSRVSISSTHIWQAIAWSPHTHGLLGELVVMAMVMLLILMVVMLMMMIIMEMVAV